MKTKLLVLILVSLFAVNAQAVIPYDYVCPEEDYKCESEQINKITQYVFTQYLNEKIPEYVKPSQIERDAATNSARKDEARNRAREDAKIPEYAKPSEIERVEEQKRAKLVEAQNREKEDALEANRAREAEAEALRNSKRRDAAREAGMREILKDYSK